MQLINFTNALKLTWHNHTIVSPPVEFSLIKYINKKY